MKYTENSKESTERRGTITTEILAKAVFKWCLHIVANPNGFNVTKILNDALKWDSSVNNLVKSETNRVLIKTFNKKYMAKTALHSIAKLMEKYAQMAFDFRYQERQQGKYVSAREDEIIDRIILVIKSDLREVYEFIGNNIDDKTVTPTAFWIWLNSTARNAIKHDTKWYYYLSMNGSLSAILSKANITITEWLLRSNMGFDYEEFKKYKLSEQERNMTLARVQYMNNMSDKATYQQQNENVGRAYKNYYGKPKNEASKPINKKPRSGLGFNQILQDLNDILKLNGKGVRFNGKDFCAFWNHKNTVCHKEDKCDRKHKCMNCEGNHILETCPEFKPRK